MQPAAAIPPYDEAAVQQLLGIRCAVPRVSNPRKVWWGTIEEVLFISPRGVAVKVGGHHSFGKPRWLPLEHVKFRGATSDPLVLAIRKARATR